MVLEGKMLRGKMQVKAVFGLLFGCCVFFKIQASASDAVTFLPQSIILLFLEQFYSFNFFLLYFPLNSFAFFLKFFSRFFTSPLMIHLMDAGLSRRMMTIKVPNSLSLLQ